MKSRLVLPAMLLLLGPACRPVPAGVASGDDLLYVLQPDAVPLVDLAAAPFHWLILEPSIDGSQAGDFAPGEVTQIRSGGPCEKTLLAYLSIGEAESYRDYWDPAWVDANGDPIPGTAPPWLGPQNPDFVGNYKVRYWDPGWQALVFGNPSEPDPTPLDRILDQGFDGVYLDIVDAYEFWSGPDGGSERTRMQARADMIILVETIATYARVTRGHADFLVFPQNAADIIRDDDYGFDTDTERYFAAISGIGQEDLLYDELTPQPQVDVDYVLDQLREFDTRGKFVLVTDYVVRDDNPGPADNNARVSDFYTRCTAEGFIPYAARRDRNLDEIVTFGGAAWTVEQPTTGCPPCTVNCAGVPALSQLGLIGTALLICVSGVRISRQGNRSRD